MTKQENQAKLARGLDAIEPLEGATADALKAYQLLLEVAFGAATNLITHGVVSSADSEILEADKDILRARYHRVQQRRDAMKSDVA